MKSKKVLLLGEYSSFHNNLSKGLIKRGLDVFLISSGDTWKNYYRDIDIGSTLPNKYFRNLSKIFKEILALRKMIGYDVVQIVNPSVLSTYGLFMIIYKILVRFNKKVCLTAIGDDYFYWSAYRRGEYRKSPHKGTLDDLNCNNSFWEVDNKLIKANKYLLKKAYKIIPGSVTYKIGYKVYDNCVKNINFPIDLSKVEYKNNPIQNKVVFLHGAQKGRYGFKGTNYIDQALNNMVRKFPDLLEYHKAENLPYEDYLNILEKANVIIDQTNSYEPAMNALTSMAMGKVVMGGAEPEYLEALGIKKSPIINITSSVSDIEKKVCFILENKSKIQEWSIDSRKFVEKFYDSDIIADKFISVWFN